ncbi:DUF7009 family protein [Dyadobacter psychrotolerans]|uniref:Uncharacterized protein n=1 Tax=Dyadobacter psychrotolerans TaxID=2541721 RepID=A0A4R5E256_9BACT|nr:hypothetical protein [Dyadobacter psychrotolerans]TDE18335.1 hypothetical protein E0F88_01980 [Dyadobacter psychrotolerans]
MKIRIQGNSVRLRLSRTEVETLCLEGYIQENTSFGSSIFSYAVKRAPLLNEIEASFNTSQITMFVPETFLKNWAENNIVGLDARMKIEADKELYLLLEKDFKCLDTTEDQSDNYENPNLTC